MDDVGRAFVLASRDHLIGEYLPKIRRCLNSLDEDDLWWRPNEQSNSVGNLVLHLCGNARQWIVHGCCGMPDTRERAEEFSRAGGLGRAELIAHMERSLDQVDQALLSIEARASSNPRTLLERRVIQGLDVSVLEAVYHVVEHFAQHVGQIIYVTKMRTGSDLAFWRVEGGVAHPNW